MSSEISKQNEKLTEFLKLFQHKLRCILGAKLISIYIFWDEYVREAGWENWNQELRRDM